MTELGARLKEARLSKGYSLEDLQEITKIQKRYLTGIEEGNYSSMPGSFYVRAFIKQYAEAVGLNPDELLEEYKNEIPGTQTQEVAQSFTQSPASTKLTKKNRSGMMEAMPKLIVALFAVVIIVVVIVLITSKTSEKSDVVKQENPEVEYVKPKVEKEPVVEEEPVEEEESVTDPVDTQAISEGVVNGSDVTYEVSNTDALKIRVEVIDNVTWIGIRDENGSEKIDDRVYNPGEIVEYDSTADGYARIRLGAALATKVYVNDEELTFASQASTQNIILKLMPTTDSAAQTEDSAETEVETDNQQ